MTDYIDLYLTLWIKNNLISIFEKVTRDIIQSYICTEEKNYNKMTELMMISSSHLTSLSSFDRCATKLTSAIKSLLSECNFLSLNVRGVFKKQDLIICSHSPSETNIHELQSKVAYA